jgi:putative transposase
MLAQHAGASRFAYNQCLKVVTDALAARRVDQSVQVPWSGFDLINAFNAWKKGEDAGRIFVVAPDGAVSKQVTGLAWRHKVSAQVFEEAAIDLGRALSAYSSAGNGTRTGRQVGFPRRKRKGRGRDSFRLRNRCQPSGQLIRVGEGHPRSVTLPTIGRVRVHDDTRRLRRLLRLGTQVDPVTGEQEVAASARILFATIVRRGTRWYVALNIRAFDLHPAHRHQRRSEPEVGRFVGVDLGLVSFAVAARSDRTEVGRWHANSPLTCRLRRLRHYSRALSRARCGSRNRGKAARRVRREYTRIADARRAFLHEVSSQLVKNHACWPLRISPSAISPTTTASPAPLGTLHGRSSPGSSPTRPNGTAQSWWFATAGSRRARPARGVARAKSGSRWRSGFFLRLLWTRRGQGSQRRGQPRRLGRACLGPGPPSGRPGHQCLWKGRRWPSPWRQGGVPATTQELPDALEPMTLR